MRYSWLILAVLFVAQARAQVLSPSQVDSLPVRITAPARHKINLKEGRAGGELSVSAVIGADGAVGDIVVLKGISPEQDSEFVQELRDTRFQPAKIGDTPVAVRMVFEWRFAAIYRWPEFSFADKARVTNRSLVSFQF